MRGSADRHAADSAATAFWIAVGLVALAYMLPLGAWVNRPFLWVGTLFHELGHGIGALVCGDAFAKLVVSWDGSGYAMVNPSSKGAYAVTLAMGLLGPAIAGAIGFVMARGPRSARVALAACALLLAWAVIFKVRSGPGIATAAVIGVVCGVMAVRAPARYAQTALMVLSVLLALNSWAHRDYMLSTSPMSDISRLSNITGVPVLILGAVCIVVSLAVLGLGVALALRSRRPRTPKLASARSGAGSIP
jgi:hypothetical protein